MTETDSSVRDVNEFVNLMIDCVSKKSLVNYPLIEIYAKDMLVQCRRPTIPNVGTKGSARSAGPCEQKFSPF